MIATSQDEIASLRVFACRSLASLKDLDRELQEASRSFEIIELQIEAADIVVAAALILSVSELAKSLRDLVILEQCRLIIFLILRESGELKHLRSLTYGQVQFIDFGAAFDVVVHQIEGAAFAFHSN